MCSKCWAVSLPPAVVFVTAYDQFALRAFEAGALDYLLKPFDDARFTRALERAKQQLAGHRNPAPHPDRLRHQGNRAGLVCADDVISTGSRPLTITPVCM